jgi:hypothetical protein
VYGVGLAGLGKGGPACPPEWPVWTVSRLRSPAGGREGMSVWEQEAWIGLGREGELRLDRRARRIEQRSPSPWSDEAFLHPGLAPAAAVVAHWMGRLALHCAAVVVGGEAWGLLGDREAGKSTTAAWLAALGCPVLADDLLVLAGATAFAGPRSVDLRADAAARLGGRALGCAGGRERWRRDLPDAPVTAPLAGWVELGWAEQHRCEQLEVAARLAALDRAVGLPPGGEQLLLLADRPMLRFERPRKGGDPRADAELLLAALGRRAGPG